MSTYKKPIERTTPEELKAFLAHVKNQGLSASSMARKISTLKVFFAFLHEKHNIPNQAEGLIFPKVEKRLPTYLTEQEVQQLLKAADADHSSHGLRNRALLYLLYSTGMRISELTQTKISDLHFDSHTIKVHGKGGKERLIPVPAPVMTLLQEYVQYLQNNRSTGSDYLFATRYGGKVKPITRQACWIILKRLWKTTGNTKSISPHQLRHSLATHLLKKGADLRSLQTLLGHENVATVQIYTHVDTNHLRDIYDKKHPRSK